MVEEVHAEAEASEADHTEECMEASEARTEECTVGSEARIGECMVGFSDHIWADGIIDHHVITVVADV